MKIKPTNSKRSGVSARLTVTSYPCVPLAESITAA